MFEGEIVNAVFASNSRMRNGGQLAVGSQKFRSGLHRR